MPLRNYKFRIPLESEAELKFFTEKALGINIPNKKVCKEHDTPFQAFADAYFAKEPVYVWHAARGFGGKSVTLAALGLTEAVTLKADVSILGGSGEQSQNVHRYNQMFWANDGMQDIKKAVLSSEPTQRETSMVWGNTIRALLASQTSVRGPHPQRLRCVAGDTLIATPSGDICIADINVGTTVFGVDRYNRRTHTNVTAKSVPEEKFTVRLILSNGRSLVATPDHLVKTDMGYREIQDIGWYQYIIIDDDNEVAVAQSIMRNGRVPVYDITTESHNFIANGIVVHNCDEIDEMEIKILDAALGQPMSKNGVKAQTVLSSTWQNPNGTMTEILKRARHNGWEVKKWCMHETVQPHGWLPQEDIETKRKTVTEYMWETEYCLASPTAESRAIHPSAFDLIFDEKMGKYDGGIGQTIEIDPLTPEERQEWDEQRKQEGVQGLPEYVRFISGADWAKEKDNTIIYVFREDCSPMRLVVFYRMARAPWPVMVGKLDEYNKKYHARSHHDNTGLGDVINDYLETSSRGINMVGRARKDLLSNAINSLERGRVVMPYIRYIDEEFRGCSVNDVYGTGHLPDTLSAFALTMKGTALPNAIELFEFI